MQGENVWKFVLTSFLTHYLDGLYPENAHEKSLAPSTNGVWPTSPYEQQHFISKLKIYAVYNPSNSIVKLSKVFLSKQTTQKSYLRTLWNAFCRRKLVWCVLSSSVGKEAWLRSKDTFDIILNHSAVQKPFYFTEKHLKSPMLKRWQMPHSQVDLAARTNIAGGIQTRLELNQI